MALLVFAVLALTLAATMSVLACRLHQEERRRSEARVAALAPEIHQATSLRESAGVRIRGEGLRIQPITSRKMGVDYLEVPATRVPTGPPELFGAAWRAGSGSRLTPVLIVGFCAVATASALIVVIGRASRPVSGPGSSETHAPASSAPVASVGQAPAPLELLALGQDRDNDRLTVHGILHNPVSGAGFDRLAAVVLLFTHDGEFLGTASARIETPTLGPGAKSAFMVTVAHASQASRYRISFRSDDHVVPHVDLRNRDSVAHVK
jgi:hypothetical protein